MTVTRRDAASMFGATSSETFLGLPHAPLDSLKDRTPRPTSVIFAAPCATPYASVGAYCAGAPRAIREAMGGYSNNIAHMDFDLGGPMFPTPDLLAVDAGDLPCKEDTQEENRRLIREATATILSTGAVPILLGGDDSVPIPFLEAYADHGPITIVQIDAHIDWRDEVQGERLGLSSTMRRARAMGHVDRIIQVGQRGLGSARPSDWVDAVQAGVAFVTARELNDGGPETVLSLVAPGSRVVIAFDCDALDPAIMPSVIAPSPGGLTYWQALDIIHGIAGKARIAGFDLVELMPDRDIQGIGALTAGRLIANVLGLVARASVVTPS
ncbi:MAG: arginase family protein [Hyphomicrobiales bacterium]